MSQYVTIAKFCRMCKLFLGFRQLLTDHTYAREAYRRDMSQMVRSGSYFRRLSKAIRWHR